MACGTRAAPLDEGETVDAGDLEVGELVGLVFRLQRRFSRHCISRARGGEKAQGAYRWPERREKTELRPSRGHVSRAERELHQFRVHLGRGSATVVGIGGIGGIDPKCGVR